MAHPQINWLSDRFGGVELEGAHLGFGLPEVTVSNLWESLPVKKSLKRDERLVKQSQIGEHPDL